MKTQDITTERMTWPERAMQIWQILIAAAHDRRTMTYHELADILGFAGAGVFSQPQSLIMNYCEEHDLPPLTVLVVNETTGLPGAGLTTIENLPCDREDVFSFAWYRLRPVQIDDFVKSQQRSRDHREAAGIPDGITPADVLEAMAALDRQEPHAFGASTRYDLLHQGRRYPPKAVIGLAARRVAGQALVPDDFTGGEGSRCFRILRGLGFDIVRKTPEKPNDEMST